MNILDLLKHTCTDLPLTQSNGTSFKGLIEEALNRFLNILDQVDDDGFEINAEKKDIKEYKKNIKVLCRGLNRAINKYYEGSPALAYNSLKRALEESKIKKYLNKNNYHNEGKDFYRIRNFNGSYPLPKHELFHIPFEKRGKVKSQRFSIPGLPSLYVSNSIYVAWEEMKRPDFNCLQAIRLVNNRQITYLDLRTDVYNPEFQNAAPDGNVFLNNWDLMYQVLIWPLVACCSVRVKHSDDSFKPEYIIPQLLLQWVNKEKIDGIMYSSTHIDFQSRKLGSIFYNLVLPVKSFKDLGYCDHLSSLFETTEVLPMQLRQFSTVSDRFSHQPSISRDVNPELDEIELIKDIPQPYMHTSFGILEHSLKGMPTSPI